MEYVILVILLLIAIVELIVYIKIQIKTSTRSIKKRTFDNVTNNYYFRKPFMTTTELNFYNKIKVLESYYKIVPQINLGTIINKFSNNKYRSELNRYIDFAIFTSDYSKLLLLIELNDSTHNQKDRIWRDKKVKSICNSAEIKLIAFYTKYPNEQQYVINRILKEIQTEIF